jgi:predicted AAA+ superfamily ATPase
MVDDFPVPTDLIARPRAQSWLNNWRSKDLIKMVTGVRRSGKSAALAVHAQQLESEGAANVIKLNFENPEHTSLLADPLLAYNTIIAKVVPDAPNYLFLDEVQLVKDFERLVDGLYLHKNIDLYVTGSNASLLSGELATLLSGRYVELKMFPLSFAEYAAARLPQGTDLTSALTPRQQLYAEYISNSGFPYSLQIDSDNNRIDYLNGILNTVLIKDVATRLGIRDITALERIIHYAAANIGGLASDRKIAGALTSAGQKTTGKTVANYLRVLNDAFLFYPTNRIDVRNKELLAGPQKQYIVDLGLRRAIVGGQVRDTGHILENVVYLELLRRGGDVRVGKIDSQEVDFVVDSPQGRHYYQVSATIRDDATFTREMAPLQMIRDNYPKTLLTLDDDPETTVDGIRQQNALLWMLGDTER